MEVPNLDLQSVAVAQKPVVEVTTKAKVFYKSKKPITNGGYGTGRRKSAVARVWVTRGNGRFVVNKKDANQYFAREVYVKQILQLFAATGTSGQFDVICTVKGSGTTGQAGAILMGVARALSCVDEQYHGILRKLGALTRDSRVVERKKYGQHKARKSTQFSKR